MSFWRNVKRDLRAAGLYLDAREALMLRGMLIGALRDTGTLGSLTYEQEALLEKYLARCKELKP